MAPHHRTRASGGMNDRRKIRRIEPVCGPMRAMLLEMARDPATRDVIAEIDRSMAEDHPTTGRQNREPRPPYHLPNGIRIDIITANRAKAALELGDGIALKDDTLVARGTSLPAQILMTLPGRPLGDVVTTGRPEIDALPIRMARQGGRTLALMLDTTRGYVTFDELLGRTPA